MKQYDYLIVGSGLFGATFAYSAKQMGKRSLVIDKRPHLSGNIYYENIEGIKVQNYGAELWGRITHCSYYRVSPLLPVALTFQELTEGIKR